MKINITTQDLKEAFSSYRDYIRFLIKLSKKDKDIKLPYYNLFADVFASNGSGVADIYSDGKTVTTYCEGLIMEVNKISEGAYDNAYVEFMVRQYEERNEVPTDGDAEPI